MTRLEVYLALEKVMVALDDDEDETLADHVRNLMDEIWFKLSDQDRSHLNDRK